MGYTISIKDISYNQMHEINNKLGTFGSGLSATSVDDKGERWNVSVTTGDFNTKQVFGALTAVLSQSVAIPYYTIDQLPSDVQKRVCQAAIDANIYWDVWQDERNHSFSVICDKLDLQWDCDNYDNYYVEETSNEWYAKDIIGASRVIAYIVNRWGDFKQPMYIDKNKHSTFYKLLHKKGLPCPKSLLKT